MEVRLHAFLTSALDGDETEEEVNRQREKQMSGLNCRLHSLNVKRKISQAKLITF